MPLEAGTGQEQGGDQESLQGRLEIEFRSSGGVCTREHSGGAELAANNGDSGDDGWIGIFGAPWAKLGTSSPLWA